MLRKILKKFSLEFFKKALAFARTIELLGMHELKGYRMNWREKRRDNNVAGIRMGENLVCFVCNSDKHIDSQIVPKE